MSITSRRSIFAIPSWQSTDTKWFSGIARMSCFCAEAHNSEAENYKELDCERKHLLWNNCWDLSPSRLILHRPHEPAVLNFSSWLFSLSPTFV